MDFIKILFNIAFTVLPLLLQLLLQIPAARTTSENNNQNAETTTTTTTIATSTATATTTNSKTTSTTKTTATYNNNKNKNNITTRELRKHEQIIDNSIDFTVDPCDDFYQYACGEWKPNYDNQDDVCDNNDNDDGFCDGNGDEVINNDYDNTAVKSDKYDRTLAMIDYLADKEVLKYFNVRNLTKKLNTNQTQKQTSSFSSSTYSSSSSSPSSTTTTTTTKEPDFIIKVYKYYKSCIAIQQYEPIKYLEWLELNEHVKWPSLINTTTTTTSTATNSEEKEEEDADIQHDQPQDAQFTTDLWDEDDFIVADDGDIEYAADEPLTENEPEQEKIKSSLNLNNSWINTLALLRKYGLNGIFIEEVIYTTKTFPSKMLLGFNKPLNEGGFKSLKIEHLKSILNNLNLNITKKAFQSLWLQITKFEWQLTKLNDLSDDFGTAMITVAHLPVTWLSDYMQVLFNQTQPMDGNMRLVITNVAYFMALDDLLNEYDDNFLKQYLQIRFLWHLYQREPKEFQPMDCILHIKHYMPLAFEWIYEKQHDYLNAEIPYITEMFNNLRKQFNQTLYNNKNNLDSSTLEKFVSKLESIQFQVGTFNELDQAEFFYENRKFFNTLKFSSNEFYANHMKMLKFNFDALHFGMRSISTNSLFYDMQEYNHGLLSDPHFNQRLNILHIPLSLLQSPVYHQDYSDVYKYSSFGFILAQTLMYGFNLNGLAVNEQEKIMKHFKCLSTIDTIQFNDKIADVSGFRLAYHTFFYTTNNNLIANRKIFFLNFAQTFCGSPTSDDNLGRSPVNYALAQLNEFAKTFQCSPDSHMNPHEKCYLWD